MKISVVVCTLNRSESLKKTLESIAASELPASEKWEVVVVDNNSTDQTREVVESISRRYPGIFRYAFEPQSGKSFALNTGVRLAQSEILAFVDDDVTVEPSWLKNLTAPLREGEWAGSGGRTLPPQSYLPPRWLGLKGQSSLGGVLAAVFDLGDEPCRLNLPPYGANMAYRRGMFEKYGLFRTDLGPSPNKEIPRPNEDTEFGRRLLAAGERLRYEPSAVVYHPINEYRVQKKYFLGWWFDYGRAMVREWGRGPDILGIPRPWFNILNLASTNMVPWLWRWTFTKNPQFRFYNKCMVWMVGGQIREFYKRARSGQARTNASMPSDGCSVNAIPRL